MALTLQELVNLVGGTIVRAPDDHNGALDERLLQRVFTGMASLDQAGAGDVSFLGNAKYYQAFQQSAAGAIVVPKGERGGARTAILIEVENPTMVMSQVIEHFHAQQHVEDWGVHPRAWVDPTAVFDAERVSIHPGVVVMAGAVIGNGTQIHANAVIGRGVKVGENCLIYANVTIREGCELGSRVIVQPGAVIGADGFGYEFVQGRHQKIPQVGVVVLGDDVEIGANTTIDRARFGKTVIGTGTKIDNLVQVGHNVQIGEHCLVIALTGLAGSCKLGNYVTVAAQVGVAGHLEIGDHAVLAARTGVTGDLKGGQVYMGNPAHLMKDELKVRALARRLPKMAERLRALERKRTDAADPSSGA